VAICDSLDLLLCVWLRISEGMNCCQEFRRGVVYRLIGVRIDVKDVNDFNLWTEELGCNYWSTYTKSGIGGVQVTSLHCDSIGVNTGVQERKISNNIKFKRNHIIKWLFSVIWHWWSSCYFLYITYTITTWSVHYFPMVIMWLPCVTSHICDCDCDFGHVILSCTLYSYVVSPKEKKKKRNINNDLAVLLSHDTDAISIALWISLLPFCQAPLFLIAND